MALAAVRPLRLVLTAAALLVLAPAAACGGAGPAPHPSSPAPHSPSPAAGLTSPARASSTPADLSGVLIQPAGFSAVPDDTVSGPLQTATDVRNFFTDRPGDPGEILGHGFAGGYVQQWQPAQNPSPGSAPALLEIVLQFDTAAHALAVEQYFKHAGRSGRSRTSPYPPG